MTNETTASQPKSIGDDAQFNDLLLDYRGCCVDRKTVVSFIDNFFATADQASATIEAAPTFECGACHGSGWVPRDPDIGTEQECFCCGGSGEDEEAALVAQAATIQEPVMVAEPVDDGLPPEVQKLFDQLRPEIDYWCTHRRESNLAALDAIEFRFKVSQARTVRLERAALAAPMVADPAGVARPAGYLNKEGFLKLALGEMAEIYPVESGSDGKTPVYFAATVKAVPSEALEVVASGYEGGTMISDPTGLGATISMHYASTAEAENAFDSLTKFIDGINFAAPLADKTGGGE